jgi:sulfur carrier protein ThiS
MIIKIVASSLTRKYNIPETLELKDGASIADALAELPVPLDMGVVGLTSLNGKAAPRDAVLKDGDKLEIFPMIVDG